MTDKSDWEEIKEAFKSDFKKLGNHPNLEGIKSSPIWKSLKIAGKEIKEKYDSHQLTKYRYTGSKVYSIAKLAKGICIKSDIEFDYISSHYIFYSFIEHVIEEPEYKSVYKRELSEIRPSDYTFENTDFNIPINVEVYEFKQRDKKNEFHYFLKKLKERWEMRSLILEKNLDGKQKNTGPEIERLKIILHHNEAFFWGQQWNLVGPYAPLSITDIQDTNRHLKIMARVFQVINEYPNHTF